MDLSASARLLRDAEERHSRCSLSYRARTNRTQSFVLVFYPVPVNAKGFWL